MVPEIYANNGWLGDSKWLIKDTEYSKAGIVIIDESDTSPKGVHLTYRDSSGFARVALPLDTPPEKVLAWFDSVKGRADEHNQLTLRKEILVELGLYLEKYLSSFSADDRFHAQLTATLDSLCDYVDIMTQKLQDGVN